MNKTTKLITLVSAMAMLASRGKTLTRAEATYKWGSCNINKPDLSKLQKVAE